MRRLFVTIVAVLFVGAGATFTVMDFSKYGITGLGVVSLIVVVIVGIGILGALFQKPPPRE